MAKTISMSIEEYEKDLMARQEAGLCDALNQVRLYLIAKKTPAEFFGPESLDPRLLKCKLMLDILNELQVDPVEVQKVTKVIVPPANATHEGAGDASQETPVDAVQPACTGQDACNDAQVPEAPINQ